jgi:hypothetical protein
MFISMTYVGIDIEIFDLWRLAAGTTMLHTVWL